MNIGQEFAICCLESIKDSSERLIVESKLKMLGKEIVSTSVEQMYQFCGNVLQLKSNTGEPKIVMSIRAFRAFMPEQLSTLEKYGEIISVDINTIEEVGGGSARCMLAEVFKDNI